MVDIAGHAHDPARGFGWSAEYLVLFGDVQCRCAHPLRFHVHDGVTIPCRITACGCGLFRGPLTHLLTRVDELADENKRLREMIEGILQIWDFVQRGDTAEVGVYLGQLRAAIDKTKKNTRQRS